MKLVFEAIVTHPNLMGSENRQLFSSLRKAHKRLVTEHAASEWASHPLPPLSIYRDKLREFSSHSADMANKAEVWADFAISVRPVN